MDTDQDNAEAIRQGRIEREAAIVAKSHDDIAAGRLVEWQAVEGWLDAREIDGDALPPRS